MFEGNSRLAIQDSFGNFIMDVQIFDREIKSFLHRRPFHQFRISFADGESLTIRKPEELHSHNGGAIYFHADGEMTLFDFETVSGISSVKAAAKPRRRVK